jgi:HSP90 family molecular chaperone
MKEFEHRHIADVKRIREVIGKYGRHVSLPTAAGIWENYSDLYAAGWLGLPDDDEELWLTIEKEVYRISGY